jgi:hypothetical protein
VACLARAALRGAGVGQREGLGRAGSAAVRPAVLPALDLGPRARLDLRPGVNSGRLIRSRILRRVSHSELTARPRWYRTDDPCFPVAAQLNGGWWILRLNDFPDHRLWTLFVGGQRRFDIDDVPATWGKPSCTTAVLEAHDARAALAPVRDFVAYGSEIGQPCDNPFCCGWISPPASVRG